MERARQWMSDDIGTVAMSHPTQLK